MSKPTKYLEEARQIVVPTARLPLNPGSFATASYEIESAEYKRDAILNGICAYFTMFPLEFPYLLLRQYANVDDRVLDPFCGRGTTNYASRLLGLPSVGLDSHPLAVAVSKAKLINVTPQKIVAEAVQILGEESSTNLDVPEGEFWRWAYHPNTLNTLCRLREGLLKNCRSNARKALRAVILGGLHGPVRKTLQSYFSNQMPRTFAPKPAYSVKYWKTNNLTAPQIDVVRLITSRANRYFGSKLPAPGAIIREGDSRAKKSFSDLTSGSNQKFNWVITSPPYYGMRTYKPDQWLRLWFLGGASTVDYSNEGQLVHTSPDDFVADLRSVWINSYKVSEQGANLVVRFGGINDRSKVNPLDLLYASLVGSGWELQEVKSAGTALLGHRQADTFSNTAQEPMEEYDLWAVRTS